MNDSRRSFLKKATLLAGGAGLWTTLPMSIEKALAIAPAPGTTFYDAEHVVMLMQENRSFDHCFGTLRGVRGFNDPLAITLPDKNPVWFQPDRSGNRFIPFRLDMKDTRATWMGGVPHSWLDQVDARNNGKYDGWIEAKRPGNKEFSDMPLTMGYYNREDIPFYYAFADAFTVCDQHFCASLTGTTTNRSYFWTGKTHGDANEKARVRNGELDYDKEGSWTTFPERLEDAGVSWKVYQNEISLPTEVEDDSLLANFTDNNLEWFTQYNVRHSKSFHRYLKKMEQLLPGAIADLEKKIQQGAGDVAAMNEELAEKKKQLESAKEILARWTPAKYNELSQRAKNLHEKAFTTNHDDPDYHKAEDLIYSDNGEQRTTKVPKGDVLHQFRKDVNEGKLPTVSWVVAPQMFSDHPSAPWYGAWYVSEVLDILTKNPEVWKKTIFILNYDENDGYFDHVPPFLAPNPADEETGKASPGLDMTGEFVTAGFEKEKSRTSPVGLGFRVPLVIASPWSRGGWVNSEVCDITSTIMFLETFLTKKTGKKISEPNISSWRRTISGDLTSAFRPYNGEKTDLPAMLDRDRHIEEIFNAKFKKLPNNYRALTAEEAKQMASNAHASALPKQEPGTRPSNALCYDLHADGHVSSDGNHFVIRFTASTNLFGSKSLGAPFNVYAPGSYLNKEKTSFEPVRTWAFAVKAGDTVEYKWPLSSFEGDRYWLRVYGPNGFYREFSAVKTSAYVQMSATPVTKGKRIADKLKLTLTNAGTQSLTLRVSDSTYLKMKQDITLKPGTNQSMDIATEKSHGWYDMVIESSDGMRIRYAGRVETGADRMSDPGMGG